jgi:hypothetical protein
LAALGFGASSLLGTGLRLMVKASEEGTLDVVAVTAVVEVTVVVAATDVVAIREVREPDSTAAYRVV